MDHNARPDVEIEENPIVVDPNPTKKEIEAIPPEGEPQGEQPQAHKKEDTIVNNDQLFARVKKAEKEVKDLKSIKEKYDAIQNVLNGISSDAKPAKDTTPNNSDPIEMARTVRLLQTMDDVEISTLQTLAKGSNKSYFEVAESDAFKAFVLGHRSRLRKENAVPSPSGSTGSVLGKTAEEIGKMSDKELQDLEKQVLAKKRATGV